MRSLRARIGRLALLPLLLGTAAEGVQVYHSGANDGVRTAPPALRLDGTPVALHLFIQDLGRSAPSTPAKLCRGGDGSEVCLWSVRIAATGGAQLVSFSAAPGVRFHLSGNTLRVTGGNPVAATTAPDRVGTLIVRAIDSGSISAAGEYVTSGFDAADVSASTLSTTSP
jgi:hypothetical protein